MARARARARTRSAPARSPAAAPAAVDADFVPTRLGQTLDFLRLLWALDHALQSRSKRMNASYGVTGPQRLVLRVVARYDGLSAGELARLLFLHPSTISVVLGRLVERGLVTRTNDPDDHRRAVLRLTAAGRGLDGARTGTVEGPVVRALQRLSSADLAATRRVLTGLLDELRRESARRARGPAPRPRRHPRRART